MRTDVGRLALQLSDAGSDCGGYSAGTVGHTGSAHPFCTRAVGQVSAAHRPRPAEITTAPPVEIDAVEANRQARLIARCADASWLSLCLPDDRREARALRDAAIARAALRREVYQMLSENRCDDAMRTALASADMALIREVRALDVCAPGPTTAEAAADPN